ncbi:MAG TPA: hypothetical protein VIV60_15550, partial [Polyangiaceae bacterium]
KNAKNNGRIGQQQAGVDVYGYRATDGALCGIQCKRRGRNGVASGKISGSVLRAEVDKAKTFQPPLSGEFILAHTGVPDEAIQEEARRITQDHLAAGLFEVHVCAWEDILANLGDHPGVFRKHYASLLATVRDLDSEQPNSDDFSPVQVAIKRGVGLSGRFRHLEPPEALSIVDTECRAQIDIIHAALKDGQARFALTQAEALRTKSSANASGETRAHVAILVGQAFLAIGDTKAAAASLLEAANHAPDSAEVCAQVALGHSIAGNMKAVRTWATRALRQSPCHMMAIQLAISVDERSDDEILDEYEPLVGARPEVFAILGQRASDRGELTKALQWFERAIDVGGTHPELLVGAAQLLVGLVTEEVAERVHETRNTRPRLTRAIGLLDRALQDPCDAECRRARAHWYAIRVTAKQMLHAPDAAAAADEALIVCGQDPGLVRLRAAIASEAGDNAKVVALLESVSEPLDVDDLGILAAALSNLGQSERAAHAFDELLKVPDLADHQRFQVILNRALILHKQGRELDGLTLVEEAMKDAPGVLLPIIVAVTLYERLGNLERRDELFGPAIGSSVGGSTYVLSLLGDALMRAERW